MMPGELGEPGLARLCALPSLDSWGGVGPSVPRRARAQFRETHEVEVRAGPVLQECADLVLPESETPGGGDPSRQCVLNCLFLLCRSPPRNHSPAQAPSASGCCLFLSRACVWRGGGRIPLIVIICGWNTFAE